MTEAAAIAYARTVEALNRKWTPHPTQATVLQSVFAFNKPTTFVECGRKWGKTETILYKQHRVIGTSGGVGYYLTPEQKQGREIIWRPRRAQSFCPDLHAKKPNETDMSLTLVGGGSIKVDGSDNIDQLRGVEPRTVDYDEFKDFRIGFHNAMSPNYSVYNAQVLICGTPPEAPDGDDSAADYDMLRKEAIAEGAYFNFPSWANPYISREWLLKEKAKLYLRGEGDVWEREFAARRVNGGKKSIFPMFDALRHIEPYETVMDMLRRDAHKLVWQVIADPGTTTCFAVIFRAINPFTKAVYRVAEIYEQDQMKTSTSLIVPRIEAMKLELLPGRLSVGIEWEQIYDEAAAWFAAEAHASFPSLPGWTPTRKGEGGESEQKKRDGLSLIKDQMLTGRYIATDRCENLKKEVQGYIKDKNGRIPKGKDHLIDADRYGNRFASVDLTIELEAEKIDPDDQRRFVTPEQDLAEEADQADFHAEDW